MIRPVTRGNSLGDTIDTAQWDATAPAGAPLPAMVLPSYAWWLLGAVLVGLAFVPSGARGGGRRS